jgi:hypothetical protein
MANPYNYPESRGGVGRLTAVRSEPAVKVELPDYKINIQSGIYDHHFTMVNALYEFLSTRPQFDRNEMYTIKKPIHPDLNGEKHFNFTYKGKSYHAYVKDVCIVINGKPHCVRQEIYRLSVLDIFY